MQMNTPVSYFVSAIVSLLLAGPVLAQSDEEGDNTKTKQAQAVSKEVYDEIQKAQEMVDNKDYQSALRLLDRLYDPDDLTEYEQANVLNYIGFIHFEQENVPKAIETYERMLAIPSLEAQMRKQTTYTLAQLNTMEERYTKALDLLNTWFTLETNPGPAAYVLLAQVYYQLERYGDMVEPIETAMNIARERDLEVKEDWYVLLNFAYFQQENYAKVRDIQKILLQNWPKKRYWFSLAGAYTELGEDQNLIAAYDAAYTQGMFEKETEFVTMAQLYLQREVPYKAGKLLEEKMADGTVSENAKNYRLLSQAWQLAQEDAKAIPALIEAAERSNDGELDVRLGNAYLNTANYDDCADAVQSGINKGGLKNPDNAYISLGMCLYNLNRYDQSIQAFREARKTPRSRRVADQWITVIEADVERNRQIRLAQEAANKKREEVERRRNRSNRL